MTPVVTIYRYPTRAGVTPKAYIEAAEAVQDQLAATPGFQYRCLAQTDDGWFETVFWESAEAADAASEPFMKAMAGTKWMEMIDMENTKVERHPIVQSGMSAAAGRADAA
jgi:heme-degrading monooxygenase HmoA